MRYDFALSIYRALRIFSTKLALFRSQWTCPDISILCTCRFVADRSALKKDTVNFYVLAILLYDKQTAVATFGLLVKLFDTFCSNWRKGIIVNSTDVEQKKPGQLSGLIICF